MRHLFAVLMLLASAPLFAQEDCDVFNIQELSAAYLNFSVDSTILQSDGSYEVYLSNGTTYTLVQGCTDAAAANYDPAANTDDGSCATLIIEGCMDPAYVEYDETANTDDGSCANLIDPNCVSPSMDGYTYGVVQIGDQCWFSENLRSTVYADDSSIPEVTGSSAWSGLSTGARCDYNNDASNVAAYGRLYNWYAVTNAAGLCPNGWHVPTDGEWTALEDYITAQGFNGTEGTALKSTSGWNSGGNGTDNFGFSALPGGYRRYDSGNFYFAGLFGYWWSSSPSGGNAWARNLDSFDPGVDQLNYHPRRGSSVRCLADCAD